MPISAKSSSRGVPKLDRKPAREAKEVKEAGSEGASQGTREPAEGRGKGGRERESERERTGELVGGSGEGRERASVRALCAVQVPGGHVGHVCACVGGDFQAPGDHVAQFKSRAVSHDHLHTERERESVCVCVCVCVRVCVCERERERERERDPGCMCVEGVAGKRKRARERDDVCLSEKASKCMDKGFCVRLCVFVINCACTSVEQLD